MKDLLNVMSKFLAMGMPLKDVVARATWHPAREIKREDLGHLSVGAVADVTVLSVDIGKFGFTDVDGGKLEGVQRLQAELTVRAGNVVWDLNGISKQEWSKVPVKREPDERWPPAPRPH
jgi:dihydroorotase